MPHRSSNIRQPGSRYAKHTRSKRAQHSASTLLLIRCKYLLKLLKQLGGCLECEVGGFLRGSL